MKLRNMTVADLDTVVRIEQEVHAHPWTRGNFSDALAGDSICKVYGKEVELPGYFILLPAVEDMELLDIAVAAAYQRKGLGRKLLDEAMGIARGMDMKRMLLEVRVSNEAALALYRAAGFRQMNLRRGYYAAGNEREDAIVMERIL